MRIIFKCSLTSTEHCCFRRQLGLLRFSGSQSVSDSHVACNAETQRELPKRKKRYRFENLFFFTASFQKAHHVGNICQLVYDRLRSKLNLTYQTFQTDTGIRFQSCFRKQNIFTFVIWDRVLPARKPPISYVHHSTHIMTIPGTANWI